MATFRFEMFKMFEMFEMIENRIKSDPRLKSHMKRFPLRIKCQPIVRKLNERKSPIQMGRLSRSSRRGHYIFSLLESFQKNFPHVRNVGRTGTSFGHDERSD